MDGCTSLTSSWSSSRMAEHGLPQGETLCASGITGSLSQEGENDTSFVLNRLTLVHLLLSWHYLDLDRKYSVSGLKSDDTAPNALIPKHEGKRSSNFPAYSFKTLLSLQTSPADDNVEEDDTLNNPVEKSFKKVEQHIINSDTMKPPTCIEPPWMVGCRNIKELENISENQEYESTWFRNFLHGKLLS